MYAGLAVLIENLPLICHEIGNMPYEKYGETLRLRLPVPELQASLPWPESRPAASESVGIAGDERFLPVPKTAATSDGGFIGSLSFLPPRVWEQTICDILISDRVAAVP